MPLFIKAKTGQSRTIFAASTKYSASGEHTSCSRFYPRTKPKIPQTASTPRETTSKRNRHDKMPRSSRGSPDSPVDDIPGNTNYDEASMAKILTSFCPIRDSLRTKTSLLQDETMEKCLPLLAGLEGSQRDPADWNTGGLPRLEREKHIGFLHQWLKPLAAGYVGVDASRPWILYWVLAGLSLLGEDVQRYKER